ncbi:hypothetical protein AB0H43_12130 [Hamadaea sp. NPDC050747]|uniref:hypothetical protein n=1 Tax=Hamadaea sp. NPDC050747 TaxID=3155789 RepID=UPI00340854D6
MDEAGREEAELGSDVGLVVVAVIDGRGAGSWPPPETMTPTQQSAVRPLATSTTAVVVEKNGRLDGADVIGCQWEPFHTARPSGDSGSHRVPFHRNLPSGEI